MRWRIGMIMLLGLAGTAHADDAPSLACARRLAPDAALIYRDAAPDLTPETNLRTLLTSHVRRLIFDGKITLTAARPAATAAAACLQRLQTELGTTGTGRQG